MFAGSYTYPSPMMPSLIRCEIVVRWFGSEGALGGGGARDTLGLDRGGFALPGSLNIGGRDRTRPSFASTAR